MPEQHRAATIAAVEKGVINQFQGGRPLTIAELAAHGSRLLKFVVGWELPGLIPGDQYRLRVLLSDTSPFGRPRIAVYPKPRVAWPHLEEGDLLCLAEEHDPHTPENVVAATVHAIESGRSLVTDCLNEKGFDQFEDEFLSYWRRWAKSDKPIRSLCHPNGPSREVSAWFGEEFVVVAEDDVTLRKWLDGYFAHPIDNRNFTPHRIPFVWLARAPRPPNYPTTVCALLDLAGLDAFAKVMIENLLCDDKIQNKVVILGCDTRRGVGLAAVRVSKPEASKGRGDPLQKGGFRNGPPRAILLARYPSAPIVGANVVRCDPRWVHGRDHNLDTNTLRHKSVVILGVGSVGSAVATLLAQGGVGQIRLIDPQCLESENTGRHELGATAVLRSKAIGHATNLRQRFPHLEIISECKRWQQAFQENSQALTCADLVISTMGDWPLESELNATVMAQREFPPVLYGWTEAHAAAGHAVVFMNRAACLRCLTDDLGQLVLPVALWEEKTTKGIPACGGSFQPYGAIELDHINALVAELALDVLTGRITTSTRYTWIGRRRLLKRARGIWNPDWIEIYGDPGEGGRIVEAPIVSDTACPECNMKRQTNGTR